MVDRWCHMEGYDDVMNGPDAEHELRFQQALGVANHHASRCRICRMDSVTAAATFADRSLDFVYIDGDHSYAGCRRDILAWAPKVKVGGVWPAEITDEIATEKLRQCLEGHPKVVRALRPKGRDVR
jgi:hypothetical protein